MSTDGTATSDVVLDVDPRELLPLQGERRGAHCKLCDRPRAVWLFAPEGVHEDAYPMCSLCYLYASPWASPEHEKAVRLLADEVERAAKTRFKRTLSGRLSRIEDADRLLASVAISSRVARMQKMAALMKR